MLRPALAAHLARRTPLLARARLLLLRRPPHRLQLHIADPHRAAGARDPAPPRVGPGAQRSGRMPALEVVLREPAQLLRQ
eukprot:4948795-Pyramimonas_sp.AAC.1